MSLFLRQPQVGCADNFLTGITRKKEVNDEKLESTQLSRTLSLFDLTALGVGSTLGAGIYVVAGSVAKETAGPGVMISFMIAAAASVLAGLCYAEFGARVPKTGSAYIYSYVSVGELMAFIIGWNLILEYVIGTSSVARALSSNLDSLFGNQIQAFFLQRMPIGVNFLSPYPDFLAFGITLLLTVILALGVRESSTFNNIFTSVNILVVLYVIICGLFKADITNWNLNVTQVVNTTQVHPGNGGYLPFGFSGVIAGAGTCFYAFVGFDVIATTGEEAKNPQRAIPLSIMMCLFVCSMAYFGVAAVVTLMCPYYLLDSNAPLPFVFERVGWNVAKYITAVGAVVGLSASLLGAMFPLPRVIYAMANDGLIYRFLAQINSRFKTPVIATILSGLLSGAMACLFDLAELVNMMAIGTLLAYTLVAVSVMLLRTTVDNNNEEEDTIISSSRETIGVGLVKINERTHLRPPKSSHVKFLKRWAKYSFIKMSEKPVATTQKIAIINTCLLSIFLIALNVILIQSNLSHPGMIVGICILAFICVVLTVSIAVQPESNKKLSFKVPFVPYLPAVSMFVNIQLMLKLPVSTWIRFGVWIAIGFLIYFTYGLWNSSERKRIADNNYETTMTEEFDGRNDSTSKIDSTNDGY